MRCGTLLSRTVLQHRPASGEMFGSVVAEHSLVAATLKAYQDIAWEFINTESYGGSESGSETNNGSGPELAELARDYQERVTTVSPKRFLDLGITEPYIFITSAPAFAHLASLRRQCRLTHVPICCLVHSLVTRNFYQVYQNIVLQSYDHDVVVAPSAAAERGLGMIFNAIGEDISRRLGDHNNKVTMPEMVRIPYGIEIAAEAAVSLRQAREQLRLPLNAFVMLCLGRLSDTFKNDLNLLLGIVKEMANEQKAVHLVLAGQSEDSLSLGRLRRRVTIEGLDRQVTLIENFPEVLKSLIIESCDVVVLPADSIQETFGLAILEAMSHGKPLVASSWSGFRDLISDHQTGFLCKTVIMKAYLEQVERLWPLTEPRRIAGMVSKGTALDRHGIITALRRLRDDPVLAERMGKEGKVRCKEIYAWPRVGSLFRDLWMGQIERGQSNAELINDKPFEYGRIFSQWADAIVDDSSELDSPCNDHEGEQPSHTGLRGWCNEGQTTCSVAELIQRGVQYSDIATLIKQGQCRI